MLESYIIQVNYLNILKQFKYTFTMQIRCSDAIWCFSLQVESLFIVIELKLHRQIWNNTRVLFYQLFTKLNMFLNYLNIWNHSKNTFAMLIRYSFAFWYFSLRIESLFVEHTLKFDL